MARQNFSLEKIVSVKYLLYPILGTVIFYTNSQLDFNYFIKGYLSFMELQIAVIAIYFITSKIRKNRRSMRQ